MRLTFIRVLTLLLAFSTSFWTNTAALPVFTFFTKKPDQLQQKKFGSDQTLVAALPSAISGHGLSTGPVPSVDNDTLARFKLRPVLETTSSDKTPSGTVRGARSARLLHNPKHVVESTQHEEPPKSIHHIPSVRVVEPTQHEEPPNSIHHIPSVRVVEPTQHEEPPNSIHHIASVPPVDEDTRRRFESRLQENDPDRKSHNLRRAGRLHFSNLKLEESTATQVGDYQ